MTDRFFLDPLEGEISYPEEPIFGRYIAQLPSGKIKLRFAPGRTELAPAGPLIVGCCYDLTLTYYPEEQELSPGTVLAFEIPRTWTQPHDDVLSPGFVRAERSGGACELEFSHNGNLQWWIKARVIDSSEPSDGFVRILYHDVTIQRFPQHTWDNWRSVFRTVIDPAGEGEYAVVPAAKTAKPVIQAAPASRFYVATPAVVRPGEEIEIRASALDYCDNRAFPSPVGDVFAAAVDDPYTPIATTHLTPKDKGLARLKVRVPENAETFRVSVSNRKDNLYGLGPVSVVAPRKRGQSPSDSPLFRVYFGDIHAKTGLTDGLGTPMEYFEHERDVALCDFGAIADHNCTEVSRVEGPFLTQMTDEGFASIQAACEAFNEPGRFVTIQGFEQNHIANWPGHRNVYFRGICPGLFRGETLEELYAFVEGHDALIIPHHTIIWGTRVHLNKPEIEPLIEMYSTHCSSEVKGSPINNYETSRGKEETGQSAREILDMGHRVGFIAASDNHNGAPGLSAQPSRFTNLVYRGGLAAVHAPELTRESVFDALKARRCYATSGARIYLDFKLDGAMMGSEIEAERGAELPYEITVAGTDRISRIELIANGVEETIWTSDGTDYVKLHGSLRFERAANWVYVRVTQVDRHMAWSSPIWVDAR